MLLAIDIGNSSIKFGIFEGPALFNKFSIQTKRDYTVEELMFDRFKLVDEQFIQINIDTAVVSSVVPELNPVISHVCQELFKVTPVIVNSTFDFGLKISYEPLTSAGTDRLINASSAASKYGRPVIVCSFGTATTIDAVNADGEFLGGVIAPGMNTMAEALHLKTAQLPIVRISKPDRIIGSTTELSIQSGIFNGYIGLVEHLVSQIKAELSEPPALAGGLTLPIDTLTSREGDLHPPAVTSDISVIATGGFAKTIADNSGMIEVVDENLTLDGLRLIHERKFAESV